MFFTHYSGKDNFIASCELAGNFDDITVGFIFGNYTAIVCVYSVIRYKYYRGSAGM